MVSSEDKCELATRASEAGSANRRQRTQGKNNSELPGAQIVWQLGSWREGMLQCLQQ
jgi:hypothetical protein